MYFGLPDLKQRVEIVGQFVPKYFTLNKGKAFDADIINEIAKRLEGFSGRNISYFMLSLSQQDIFNGKRLDNQKVYSLIDQAVEQSKLKNTFHTFA